MKVVTLPIVWSVFKKTAKTHILPSQFKASLETRSRIASLSLKNCPKESLQNSELELTSTTVTPVRKDRLVAQWQTIDGKLICHWVTTTV